VTWTQPLGEPFKVSLAQANIPQSLKWDKSMRQMSIDRYLRLTRAHWDSRLVIWPETAVPAFMHQVWDSVLEPLGEEARGQGSEVLLGIAALDQDTRQYYNAALVPGTDELYFKRHLVPFGEFMPLKPLLGPLLAFMEIPMSDFSAGTSEVPPLVRVANHWAGLSICYEDVFGDEVLAALPDAAFLVNLSNDGWFGDSLAPRQHLQIARLRALETGRPLLRATNTGISALIGPQGQVEAQSRPFEEAVVSGLVQPMGGMTPYARLGNGLPVGLSLLLVGMGLIWSRRPT
jgi:apolipoprotein N-acyltransferase